jgi:hypothetical protein
MAATAAMVARLRLMTAEPYSTSTYLDGDLETLIETYPVIDSEGNLPTDEDWVADYDLHSAAAEVWAEKAATAASCYDFSADGSSFKRSNLFEQYMKMSRHHNSRRQPGTITMQVSPRELDRERITNLAESDYP